MTVCGTALLIAAAVGVAALRNRRQPAPPPDVPVAALPAEVRVKAVERKPEPLDHEVVEASSAVAIVRTKGRTLPYMLYCICLAG